MSSHSGGCQCGAVRYHIRRRRPMDDDDDDCERGKTKDDTSSSSSSISGVAQDARESLFVTADFCHCRMCQKAFGNVGAALVRVPTSFLVWTRGNPSTFRSSSTVSRGFCNCCGTPLYMHEDNDDCYDVAIGTLDDPNVIAKFWTHQVGIESKMPWFDAIASLPTRTTDHDRSLSGNDNTKEDNTEMPTTHQHPDHDTDSWPP